MLRSRESPLLHDFAIVCKEGNLSRAAVSLNTVQSAVTQRMKRLEAAVGTPLLTRHSHGVTPTEQGLILLKYAKRLDNLIADAVAEIEDWESSPGGSISVGLPPSVSTVLSTPLIETLNSRLPNVELTVAEAFSGYLHGWLENDEIDLGFVFNQASGPTTQVYQLLREELFLIVDPQAARSLPNPITLKELADLPLISPSRRHGLRTDVEEAAHKQGLRLNITLEVDAGNQLIRQIIRGAGSAVLAKSAVMPELCDQSLKAIPIINPKFDRSVCLAIKKEKASMYLLTRVQEEIIRLIFNLVDAGRWPAEIIAVASQSTDTGNRGS